MTNDIPEAARGHLEEAERTLEELLVLLEDDSKPALERMGAVAEEGQKIEGLLEKAAAEGLPKDHPAIRAIVMKGEAIGPRLQELSSAATAELAEPAPATGGEVLGREAAGLVRDCYQDVIDLLADSPSAEDVIGRLETSRDDWIRKLWALAGRRAALAGKDRGDFQWGLLNGLKESREQKARIGGDLWKAYEGTPVCAVLEDLHDVSRFLEPERLSDADRARLRELGLPSLDAD